jgi:hypothetical protein
MRRPPSLSYVLEVGPGMRKNGSGSRAKAQDRQSAIALEVSERAYSSFSDRKKRSMSEMDPVFPTAPKRRLIRRRRSARVNSVDVNWLPWSVTTQAGAPNEVTASRRSRTAKAAGGSPGQTPIARTSREKASMTAPTRTERSSPPTRVKSISQT